VVRLAFGTANTKGCSASLLALLSVFFTGCANSCVFGFWNPPNGTTGTVISNPPSCKLASPKGAIRLVVQLNRSCDLCSGSNRVRVVVLSLSGVEVHSSANAVGESSSWQPLLPEPGKHPIQVKLLSEKLNFLFDDSSEELAIPAGSYDLVRLRLTRDQTGIIDDKPLLGNACGTAELNCVIMADGQIAHLVFEADTLEFRVSSSATDGGLPSILPDSNNELLIELTPVSSMVRPFGEATPSFVILPSRADMEPSPRENASTTPEGISSGGLGSSPLLQFIFPHRETYSGADDTKSWRPRNSSVEPIVRRAGLRRYYSSREEWRS